MLGTNRPGVNIFAQKNNLCLGDMQKSSKAVAIPQT